ncbi:MAG: glycosyltransferase family 2 protein [Proteobacteria bacterium]|nr:glycosyltransferase family 2 protein [Pseudomonadota bacterium]NDC23164.1 glycosyltransferase family 2 protein [Pseudomonadota bacterium]NDD03374.1 glycosyltransferase family 2 protein [Pseudomonadota bacterium]NDG25579.1 glycosyltransferase family 2 protein [Pseudomonadota bacterium]
MPQLTVAITYHNEGPFLSKCLQSFWVGPEKPDEILIYDDASTVRPESYVPSDIPVRIIRSESNQGPAKGRNILLKEAKSEWIHFHDADDWVRPTWVAKVKSQATSDCDLVLTEVTSYQENHLLSESVVGLKELEKASGLLPFAISRFILVPAGVFRTELARKIEGYRESLWQSEDWDFYVRLVATQPRFKVLLENLVGIQVRKESRSQNHVETLTCALQAILCLEKELPQEARTYLAEKAAWIGTRLFQIDQRALAREAFSVARTLGPAQFLNQKPSYRFLAKYGGQELAEWISLLYRKALPEILRKKLRFY